METKEKNKVFISLNNPFFIVAKHLLLAAILLLTTLPSIASIDKWLLKSVKINYLDDPNFNQPSGTEIAFTNGHVATAEVVDFKVIDYLDAEGTKFIIFSGKGCTECDMNTALYINAAVEKTYGLHRFEYPGTLKAFEGETVLSEMRMFYGECLIKDKQTVVYYSRFLSEENKWQQKVNSFDFYKNKILKSLKQLPYKTIKKTESLQEAGVCFEVYGVEGYAEP